MGKLWERYGGNMRNLCTSNAKAMETVGKLWESYEEAMKKIWKAYAKAMQTLWKRYGKATQELCKSYAKLWNRQQAI